MPTAIQRETQAIKSEAKIILLIVLLVSLVVYLLSGTTQVGEEQTGLRIRFGRIVETLTPGLHWGPPWPIDKVVQVPTGSAHNLQVNSFYLDPEEISKRTAELRRNIRFKAMHPSALSALANPYLVTGDMNVIHMDMQVVYRITNPQDYYRAAGDTDDITQNNVQEIARRVISNALIQVVATREVMSILGEDKSYIQQRTQEIAQQQFDELALGITIRQADSIQVTECRVPDAVRQDFDLATTADDERRALVQRALAEATQQVRQAEADRFDILTKAQSYLQAAIRQAAGEATRFKALIQEYHTQGKVIRDRLQYEKLAEVAPYLKTPIVHSIPNDKGSQRLIITIPGEPE